MFWLSARSRFLAIAPRKGGFLASLIAMDSAYRDRTKLGQMDPDRLRDIGVSRQDALLESSKPVWNLPHHWVR